LAFGTNIALIEDGAQSFGGLGADNSKSCGSPATTIATTSFFPSKPLGCYGDGGAVFTRDASLASAVASIRSHGKDVQSGLHVVVGLNARLDAIQAAVLLAKFAHFPRMAALRRRVAAHYTAAFDADGRVVTPVDGNGRHAYGVYTVRVRNRDAVAARLSDAGVGTGVYYRVCVHEQPVFRELEEEGAAVVLPVAERMATQVLSLPIHAFLSDRDVCRVVTELTGALNVLGITSAPE
jgi:UDP-2-acetamido-2-deoxy-ribo-hexuluronate aminotransferase